MDESLTERRRVMDEVLRDVNIFYGGEIPPHFWILEISRAQKWGEMIVLHE